MDIRSITIEKFHEGIINKEFTSSEIIEESLKQISEKDSNIHAFLDVYTSRPFQEAKEIDQKVSSDEKVGALSGVPIALKDNILVEDEKTTAASQILKEYRASYNATVVKKLKAHHTAFIGKTNLDEFAMGASTENSGFFTTKNPWDDSRVPGGSSGGSAAAVASGMAVAALGSDTGGSIRQPAAFCGLVGLKPTYGAVSRFGLIAMASSLDQIGPITKTVVDARTLFYAIKGKDEFDSTSREVNFNSAKQALDPKNITIGIPKEYFQDGISANVMDGVQKAIEKLKTLGFKFKDISLPHTKYALAVYYIIMPAEVSSNLSRFDGIRYSRAEGAMGGKRSLRNIYFETRGKGFGLEVNRRIILGTFVLSHGYYDAYYAKAQKVRRLIRNDFEKVFDPTTQGVDVILTPTTPTTPFKIGEKSEDPLQMYLSDVFTVSANLAGLPALSLPINPYLSAYQTYSKENLPVGFQLIGKHFHEDEILSIGELYERN